MSLRGRLRALLLGFSWLALSVSSRADAPLLHEFIVPDAAEDLELGSMTPDGRMPAAQRTPSGIISAPGFLDSNAPRQIAYGGGATPDSIDATFRLDRDTTEPSVVRYDDPFTPAVAPFKRLYAFDAVDAELGLFVHQRKLERLSVGGGLPDGYDRFFGDLFVDLVPGVAVRIPSVAPGSKLLALRVEPPLVLETQRDGAENWFVVGHERKRVRLILDLAAPRAAFGSDFADASYADLASLLTPLPTHARAAVNDVLTRLGLSRAVKPRDAVAALVAHFRSFAPSNELPNAQGGIALYTELTLDKKGVCRHRAFGFLLTALGLGVPARFVRNEAHAWVEVFDGRLWHRVDLGGAAQRFDLDTRAGAPPHVTPPDPYGWPEGNHGAESQVQTSQAAEPADRSGAPRSVGSALPPNARPRPSSLPRPLASNGAPSAPRPSGDEQARASVDLQVEGADARRGALVHVSGRVRGPSGNCGFARVDIGLVEPFGTTLLGSVPTDQQGRFDSFVTIPFDIEVGERTLHASTPGAGACGPSE
ncbi:MAG: transglutaminase domain-containing protein [Polyangiaceae bacterium]